METNLIQKLIEIKSISGNKIECQNALKIIGAEITNNQIPCKIRNRKGFPFLIAGKINGAPILFLSHIDVVMANDELFIFRKRMNKIFGRGALDMKGPLAATLDAFIKLWKSGKRNIIFVVTSDEEMGGFNGTGFLVKSIFKNIKLAIVPDSTGNDLVSIQKAPFHIKIFAKGKSAHGSKPWEGKNAAKKLIECCLKVLANLNGNLHESTTATLTQFHSGEMTNVVPNKAEAIIDIRIKQQSEVTQITNMIEAITKENQCSWKKIDEPLFFEAPLNDIFIKKWIKIFRELNGIKIRIKIENGASDARFLWKHLKIPVIVTSAVGGCAHGDGEWVDFNSLNRLSEMIVKFIISL
ncbi:MAG: M20/M25/M40 family metallo-hydrolase [Candidatus Shapirobacteria bacterium]